MCCSQVFAWNDELMEVLQMSKNHGCLMASAMPMAHHVVDKCTKDGKPVSNLQLQKILYFLQSVYCSASGGGLIFEEEFEAWPYGPVISSVYDEFRQYGGDLIERRYPDEGIVASVEPDVIGFIDAGIDVLREMAPWDLVRTSHKQGSPWERVYSDGSGYKFRIPNEYIVEAALGHGR